MRNFCQARHRVAFATAVDWVSVLATTHHARRLQAELVRLGRYPPLVIDEVGYIPFEADRNPSKGRRKGSRKLSRFRS